MPLSCAALACLMLVAGVSQAVAAKSHKPTRVKVCRIRRHGRTVACHRKKLRRKSALPPGFRRTAGPAQAGHTTTTGTSTLQLIRSFDIPSSDPSYVHLLNWSWTYDSAISAAAFDVARGAPLQADRTVTSVAYGAEFHVWPAAAAGAWLLVAEHKATPALPSFS